MRKNVDQYIRNCHSCQRSPSSQHSKFGVLWPLPVPEEPSEDISMDFVVGLPECKGLETICVVVDRLSKMRHFIPCHTTIDTLELAELFLREVVHLEVLPLTIISDRGPQLVSTLWQQIWSRLGTDQRVSTAFLPQTDRGTERMNSTLEQHLRVFINYHHDDWVEWPPLAGFTANNGMCETTKCTPFYVVQGVDPQMSLAGKQTKEQVQRHLNANREQAIMQEVHEHLQLEMRRSQAVQEGGANHGRIPAQNIQLGSWVLLDARHIWTMRPSRTLDWKRLGPFLVVRQISPYDDEWELPAAIWIHRVQFVSLLDPVVDDRLDGQHVDPPPPVEVDSEEEYQVSGVKDSHMYMNQLHYRIC